MPVTTHGKARAACLLAAGICTVALGAVSPAMAQNRLPASDEPGRIEKRFEPPRTPLSTVEPSIPDTRPAPREADRIRFTLSGIIFDGAEQPADFLPLYAEKLGREASLSDIYVLADAITAKLKTDGRNAKAVVPVQRITGGIVHIAIVPEGGR